MWVLTLWLYIAVSILDLLSFVLLAYFSKLNAVLGGFRLLGSIDPKVCITTCFVLCKTGWHEQQSAKKLSSFLKHHTKEDVSLSCSCWWELLPLVQVKLSAFSNPQSHYCKFDFQQSSIILLWNPLVLNWQQTASSFMSLPTWLDIPCQ